MSDSGRKRDFASAAAVREEEESRLPSRVLRLYRLGWQDYRIAAHLHVRQSKVERVREELGLPPNSGGAS